MGESDNYKKLTKGSAREYILELGRDGKISNPCLLTYFGEELAIQKYYEKRNKIEAVGVI